MAECNIPNCRRRAPADEAFCAQHRDKLPANADAYRVEKRLHEQIIANGGKWPEHVAAAILDDGRGDRGLVEALERIRDGKLQIMVGSNGNQVGAPFRSHLDPEEASEVARKALEGISVSTKDIDPGLLKGCWEAVNMAAETCAYEATKASTKRAASSLRLVAGECNNARWRIERKRPDLQRHRSEAGGRDAGTN